MYQQPQQPPRPSAFLYMPIYVTGGLTLLFSLLPLCTAAAGEPVHPVLIGVGVIMLLASIGVLMKERWSAMGLIALLALSLILDYTLTEMRQYDGGKVPADLGRGVRIGFTVVMLVLAILAAWAIGAINRYGDYEPPPRWAQGVRGQPPAMPGLPQAHPLPQGPQGLPPVHAADTTKPLLIVAAILTLLYAAYSLIVSILVLLDGGLLALVSLAISGGMIALAIGLLRWNIVCSAVLMVISGILVLLRLVTLLNVRSAKQLSALGLWFLETAVLAGVLTLAILSFVAILKARPRQVLVDPPPVEIPVAAPPPREPARTPQ